MIPSFSAPITIADLHCDLLSYLVRVPGAEWNKRDDIGVGQPHLKEGGVRLQVMAMFTPTKPGSAQYVKRQSKAWNQISQCEDVLPVSHITHLDKLETQDSIGILAAIENASGLCEEEEDLKKTWERLAILEQEAGPLLYISFTHHYENRFGGGNFSDNVGLKSDGKALLEQLAGRNIAVDLAHASDQLAEDIFSYVDKQRLSVPLIASHSNFRSVWNHVRNLPNELAQELILRKGLIGINFVRTYVNEKNPDTLFSHIAYGRDLGAENNLAFGADFFYTKDFPDTSRLPIFHPQHQNASSYPDLIDQLFHTGWNRDQVEKMAWVNVKRFIQRLWA